MDPRSMKLFTVFKEKMDFNPPYYVIIDEDFYSSYLEDKYLQVVTELESFIGGEVQMNLTNCTKDILIKKSASGGLALPADLINCACVNQIVGAQCIKKFICSDDFVEKVRDEKLKVILATGDVPWYGDIIQWFPIIKAVDGNLKLRFPYELKKVLAAYLLKEEAKETKG